MTEYLFPHRLSRRDFLRTAAAGATGVTIAGAAAAKAPVTIGTGKFTYTLDEEWGKLPAGMGYGYGCAIVADSQDRIYVTSRLAKPCVAIFSKDGQLLETWDKDFADRIGLQPEQVVLTAHGLYWSKEGDEEFLYWTENGFGPKRGPRIGARVYKTDLKGKILYMIGNVDKESSNSQKFNFDSPTDVAVAPNGDIYVVDGYGSQLLHRFDRNFKLLQTVGGPGKGHGQFSTCHGVWVSTLRKEPELYIADRGNNRVEVYSLDLKYLRSIPDFRLPCCFYQHGGLLYVPELGARVSVLDPDDQVVARLGDGADVDPQYVKQHPDKFKMPHALTLTSNGDLFVIEWIFFARARRFRATPA